MKKLVIFTLAMVLALSGAAFALLNDERGCCGRRSSRIRLMALM